MFADPIEEHPLLVYVTALPFAPEDSIVFRTFRDRQSYPYIPGPFKDILWPSDLLVLSGHEKLVSSVCFSPHGTRVVSGSYDKTVRVWDTQSGAQVLPPFRGHLDYVTSVNFSPDGLHIVSGSRDHTIILWDATTGVQSLPAFQGHLAWVNSVCFSPDGARIISCSHDCTIRVWGTISGNEVLSLLGHEGPVMSVSYSPDGTRIVSGSQDCTIRVWDPTSASEVAQPPRGHRNSVQSVSFSLAGDRIVSGSSDRSLRIWDAMSNPPSLMSLPWMIHECSVNSAVYSSDGTFMASASDDWTIRLWDAESGQLCSPPLRGHEDRILSLAFNHSSRGMRVASGSADNTVRIWEVRDLDVVFPNPNMRYQSLERLPHTQCPNLIGIHDLPPTGHEGAVVSLAFSPDSSEVVSCSEDMTIRIWRVKYGMQMHPGFSVRNERQCLRLAIFSSDGSKVISISDHDTIRVWDLASIQEVQTPPVTRWRPWFTSAVWGQNGTEVVRESTQEIIGPIDPESDIFLSVIQQSVQRHHRSIQQPGIFVSEGGWINSRQPSETTRISKLPPRLLLYPIVFASSSEQIAIGTRSGKVGILHFREDEDDLLGGWTPSPDSIAFMQKHNELMNKYSLVPEIFGGRKVMVKVYETE
jgi:WD40 repeat protein